MGYAASFLIAGCVLIAGCGADSSSAVQKDAGGNDAHRQKDATATADALGGGGNDAAVATEAASDAAQACDGVDPRDYGALGDGQNDDTEAFRKAAALGKTLCVYKSPDHYKLSGVVNVSTSVIGVNGPTLKMYGATGERMKYVMLEVDEYAGTGMLISGLHLDGQWDGVGQDGEWSHNIQVRASKNVTIEQNVLENPYGDNLLLGGEDLPNPSENILIRNNTMRGPRRCNIALISVRNVTIENNVFDKQTDYVTSIDAEPNPNGVDSDWDFDIKNNEFTVPQQVAVMLYHIDYGYTPDGLAGGDVSVTGNTGSALDFFAQVGNWSNVSVSGNFGN